MDPQVSSNSAIEQVRELNLAEEYFLEPVSFPEALIKWPKAVYKSGERNEHQSGRENIGLTLLVSLFTFVIFFAVIADTLPALGFSPTFFNVVLPALAGTWTSWGGVFYCIRLGSGEKTLTRLKAQEILLDYYREKTQEYRKKLVGITYKEDGDDEDKETEKGRIVKRDNQLAEHESDVRSLKRRAEDLAKNTSSEARQQEMHDYVEKLERQLAVIQEAREILQKKREEALSWLEEVESEINRVSSRLNEEKEYTQIRNEVEKLTGKTNELVSTAMEDLWETLRSMEVQLTRLSKFVDSADSQTLATSEREQLPDGGDVEIADSVEYAETVVSLTQEDVEISGVKSNTVGDKNRRVLTPDHGVLKS